MAGSKPGRRYDLPSGNETESQPGSGGRVLQNRLGICSKREMDRVEYEALIRAQTASVQEATSETRFTPAQLCRMHGEWLGEIYEWAGKYRTVNVEKDGFAWPPASRIAQNMTAFEQGLLGQNTPCGPGPLLLVARRIAEVHAELLFIHPFREGNGRLARWLADLMALQAGLPTPVYPFIGRGATIRRASYIEAVRQGYLTRYDLLTGFFADALRRGLTASGAGGVKPRAPSNTDEA